jgi:hypothetical protein
MLILVQPSTTLFEYIKHNQAQEVLGFGSSPIIPLMLSLLFFIKWLVNYKKQKNI